MHLALPSIALLALAACASSAPTTLATASDDPWCERHPDDDHRYVIACEVRELVVDASALDVEGHANGSVTVRYEDREDVLVRAKVEAGAPDGTRARRFLRQSSVDAAGGTIRTRTPDVDEGWATVSLEILAPRRTDVMASATNGPLTLAGLDGRIRAHVTNGPLTATGLAGDVRVSATNGPVTVGLAGDTWRGAGLDVEAQNGPVTLSVPAGYAARVDAATEVGRIRSDLALSARVRDRGTDVGDAITGTIGRGGPMLRLRAQNGTVRLRRAD